MTLSHPQPFALAIHGGAGLIRQDGLTPQQDAVYRASLTRIAGDAAAMLAAGARALDVVETAVRALEDDPLFNAGRGAVFTALGENLPEALARAYQALAEIQFEGMYFRHDIGHRALKPSAKP